MRSTRSWWDLPGPQSFVAEVLDALSGGISVLLALPPGTPPQLEESLVDGADQQTTLRWRTVDVSGTKKIAQLLADQLIPLARRPLRALEVDIVHDPGLSTSVIHIKGLGERQRFREFAAFLSDFLIGVRQRGMPEKCPRLICELPHDLIPELDLGYPHSEVRILKWAGRVAVLDMQLYVASRMQNRRSLGPTNLFERIVVELAGWDAALADELCSWTDEELLSPVPKLQQMAEDWQRTLPGWEHGTVDRFGGREIGHILYHLAHASIDEVNLRLWRAHVAEVFPWIEEMRLALIDRFRAQIRLPHLLQTNEVINDPNLLEIGQLFWNLKNAAGLPYERLTLIGLCTFARNDLAHRRPVGARRLRDLEKEWKVFTGFGPAVGDERL